MASSYLTRTITSSGNNKILTNSVWVKRGSLGEQALNQYNGDPSTLNYVDVLGFNSSNQLRFLVNRLGTLEINYVTNRVFRDTSAWYHIVLAVDTTQATASDRVKMYVNGVQETSFATSTAPSLNFTNQFNNVDSVISLGVKYSSGGNANYFDGSMTHFHAIDGTAYDASAFGETDATTGIWKPKTAPSVTYGTNGFFLKGENSGALGTDSSGNENNFTVNGTPTQTVDTPSNVFNTLNANNVPTGTVLENAGTTQAQSSNDQGATGNLGFTKGKWYWELKCINGLSESGIILNPMVKSFGGLSFVTGVLNNTTIARMFNQTGTTNNFRAMGSLASTTVGASVTYATGDIISVAIDADAGKIWFAQNGTYEGGGNPATGTSPTYDWSSNLSSVEYIIPFVYSGTGASTKAQFNFGNGFFGTTAVASATTDESGLGIFEYDVPTGYYALCTKNINEQEYS